MSLLHVSFWKQPGYDAHSELSSICHYHTSAFPGMVSLWTQLKASSLDLCLLKISSTNMTLQDKVVLIRATFLFEDVDNGESLSRLSWFLRIDFETTQTHCRTRNACKNAYIICSGNVKVCTLSADGKKFPLTLLHEGEISLERSHCGWRATICNQWKSLTHVRALRRKNLFWSFPQASKHHV